ncbi:hypothetical protein J7443_23480 [Tropicibacter sp. R15_0]|uniref:hypothetical protein n=1 Tax=Tropicibacter sp. R15_0 TaxID=2821101 RepID=UPI001ADC8EEA|nr:hypothetical protein [Tropicibacter sp. R15_0]MBO9468208.1 hypothetical protein [Tropicibacter sp. R15_0]
MSGDLKRALAKTNSLKLSVINAIIELENGATEALARGDDALSTKLSLQAGLLARESAKIRKAETSLRRKIGLGAAIAKLNTLSSNARKVLKAIRRGVDLIENADLLVKILTNVAKIAA